MTTYKDAKSVTLRCEDLKTLYQQRNRNIVGWYDLLALTDELEQKGMESVVVNDPRTFYNTALHLLTPEIPHRIPVQGQDKESIAWASSLEQLVDTTWAGINRQYRRRGRKSWLEYMVGLMLATGWYSVLAIAATDKLIAEVWNPYEVFPDWDGQDMYSVAHIFSLDNRQARRLFQQRGWTTPSHFRGQNIIIFDLWEVTDEGVINATTADGMFVKPETIEPFEEIPIIAGPVGGLPDDGPIGSNRRRKTEQEWRASIGQSILATNQAIYKNQNRVTTFMQQILRDTAQPKYWDKGRGGPVVTPEELERRGGIFHLGEDQDMGTVAMPGIPVELTALINSYEQMVQRGSLPRALSGQVQNIPMGLMSQVAAAAVQVLSSMHSAVKDILSEVDNTWTAGILGGVFEAGAKVLPQNVPMELVRFDVKYPIHIPGDLVQRATITRMISPNARISPPTALDLFWPEIQDPQAELAVARADDAQQHPLWQQLTLISALREESDLLRKNNRNEDAALLDKAQEIMITQIMGAGAQPSPNGRAAGGVPPEGMSPNEQALLNQVTGQ